MRHWGLQIIIQNWSFWPGKARVKRGTSGDSTKSWWPHGYISWRPTLIHNCTEHQVSLNIIQSWIVCYISFCPREKQAPTAIWFVHKWAIPSCHGRGHCMKDLFLVFPGYWDHGVLLPSDSFQPTGWRCNPHRPQMAPAWQKITHDAHKATSQVLSTPPKIAGKSGGYSRKISMKCGYGSKHVKT